MSAWFCKPLLPAVLALACVVGCARQTATPDPETGRLFALSLQSLNNPVFTGIRDGIAGVLGGAGRRLEVADARFDSQQQKADIAALLVRQPAVLFINPVNWEGIRSSLIEAARRKVPVIIVDAPVSDPDLVLCQVASDNIEAGGLVCGALAAKNPRARVAILHLSLNRACIDRVEGFKAAMAHHPDMRILDIREGRGHAAGSLPVMRELLERHQDLDAVFAVNDPSALGAIRAIGDAGKSGAIDVVAVDGSEAGLAAIRAGQMLATAAQSPLDMGRRAARYALDHLAGRTVPRDVKLPVRLITRDGLPPGGGRETDAAAAAAFTTGTPPQPQHPVIP